MWDGDAGKNERGIMKKREQSFESDRHVRYPDCVDGFTSIYVV